MHTSDTVLEENRCLRRAMRDLVALSTLPAIWTGLAPEEIARSLANVLLDTLAVDFVYVRLASGADDGTFEILRCKNADECAVLGSSLASLFDDSLSRPRTIRDPLGSGTMNVAFTDMGIGGECGAVVAGARDQKFPTEHDRLLLSVGANQTAIVLQRRRAEDEVREQREWLRVTLASIGDAVIATDTEGRVTYLNPVAQRLTGWTEGEAKGQPLKAVFQIVHELTRQSVENPVAKVLQYGRVVGLGNDTVLIAKDGAERPIDDSAAPIEAADGSILGVVLIFRNAGAGRAGAGAGRLAAEYFTNAGRKSCGGVAGRFGGPELADR